MDSMQRSLAPSTVALAVLFASASGGCDSPASAAPPSARSSSNLVPPPRAGLLMATFAGGCFWCTEAAFETLPGVTEAISGYTGGAEVDPTYEQVSSGETGHAEAVRVVYDPRLVTYEQLLDVYWHSVDPTTVDQSFVDEGHQYRSVIFVHSAEQRAAAEASKRALTAANRFGAPIVTTIEDAGPFYRAEGYHQNYCTTTPGRYQQYKRASGREAYQRRVWGATGGGH
jgi:methionine-S-sulfoxide reductase